MKQQHGEKWKRQPSNSVNSQYKSSLDDYSNKMLQAGVTDDQINQKFSANQEGFALLSKTRAELAAMVPVSQGAAQFE